MEQKFNTMVEVASKIIRHKQTYDFFVDLYFRWLDEREYEDIGDYIYAMRESLDSLGLSYGEFLYKPQSDMEYAFHIVCKDGILNMKPNVRQDGSVSLDFYKILNK